MSSQPQDADTDKKSVEDDSTLCQGAPAAVPQDQKRGFSAWCKSTFTKRFIYAALAGQFVSVCITSTSITTTELVKRGWSAPTTQTFFLYFFLFVIYTPWTIYRYGPRAWVKMVMQDGWKYFILASVDVEGNFTVVKAFQYTDLLSCLLLDAWATPVCMFCAWILLKTRYHWTQYLGVIVCIAGLGLLVVSDFHTDKNYPALDKPKGDGFMILGATLYGVSNALQEFLVRQRPLYEVVGQLGLWGTLINGVQAAALEHNTWGNQTWTGATVGILIAYTVAMLCLYTLVPIIFRLASSPFYNISILTSDFWGLIFGLGLYHYQAYWLYFIAFALVLVGLVVYFSSARPEDQGVTKVVSRGVQQQREEASGRVRVAGQ